MKKIVRWLCQICIIGITVLLLFEISYRFSIIDFYKGEFIALNSNVSKDSVDYLVFGDSFSAAGNNYVDRLRRSSGKTFINSSVPGLGIRQVNTFAGRRLKKYTPKNIIYQIYVGNDLTDVDHLTNYETLSVARNLYWGFSDILISSSYINYRLGSFSNSQKTSSSFSGLDSFSIERYSARSRLFISADKEYLFKTITITEDFEDRYQLWLRNFKRFIDEFSGDTTIYLLFVPHCTQLNKFYRNRFNQLGAVFRDQLELSKTNYSFLAKATLDLAEYKNVTFLNPLAFMREKDVEGDRLYYNNDPHLNDLGQNVLAEYLEKKIKF